MLSISIVMYRIHTVHMYMYVELHCNNISIGLLI